LRIHANRPAILLALLAASAAALAGCTDSGKTGAASASANPAHGLPAGVVNATAVPSAVPNNAASRKNVTISSCKATKDGWQASGTAANPGHQDARYTVTVFFTTTGGTVIGTGQSRVTVKPGAHQPWTISATFHAPTDTRCVLRGVG
jgi:hypothetical protein